MRLLITRPPPDGERTAEALRARGHEAVLMPLLRIETVVDADFGEPPFSGILLTSTNACRALAAHKRKPQLIDLPVFAVGQRTAAAARAVGFSEVMSADGNVESLARLVAARRRSDGVPLLYAAGLDRAGDLESALRGQGVAVRTVVVYRAIAEAHLSPAVAAELDAGQIDGVLHFSARSAEAFVKAVQSGGQTVKYRPLKHYCLSAQVAAPLVTAGIATIAIAPGPHESALLDLLDRA